MRSSKRSKRASPYQKLLLVLLTAGITLLVGMVLSWLLL